MYWLHPCFGNTWTEFDSRVPYQRSSCGAPVAQRAHNPKRVGSIPTAATNLAVSISQDIISFVGKLRRMPGLDVERISYTLSEAEWLEFARELDALKYQHRMDPIWKLDQVIFYGMTVRKEKKQDADCSRVPLRIQVREF